MCAKNTDTANIETKGYCWYKSTNGIKRHLLADVLGNAYFVKCTAANVSDDAGLLAIIKEQKDYFLNLPDGHPLTILLDNGYHQEYLEAEIEKIEPLLRNKIKIELSAKITRRAKGGSETRKSIETRICSNQKAVDSRAHECVDQSMPGVVEELRRIAENERSKDSDLRDSVNTAENRLT
jgi:hypothetical protein